MKRDDKYVIGKYQGNPRKFIYYSGGDYNDLKNATKYDTPEQAYRALSFAIKRPEFKDFKVLCVSGAGDSTLEYVEMLAVM